MEFTTVNPKIFGALWCCSGGLSRVDTMEGKKKSSYQLENFTRSLPTPVNR
ncbi:hypothetical protein YC2023_097836 [Brassica napus]